MRKVVCNTSPILSLLKIERLDILQLLYRQVIIPKAVWQEIEAEKDKDYYVDLSSVNWLDIQEVNNPDALEYLTDLDRGEAEVIVLAREIQADLVIIDETLGRQYASYFNLQITGTLGILLRAKKEGHIPEIKPLLETLRNQGVWISDNLFQEVVKLSGEI